MQLQGQIQRHFTDDDYLSIPIPETVQGVVQPIAIAKLFADKLLYIPFMMLPSSGHVMTVQNGRTLYLIQHQVIQRQGKTLQKAFKKHQVQENEEIFDVFIKCLHYDNIAQFITNKNVFHLLALASKYKTAQLKNTCNDFVSKHWQDIDVDNIFLALAPFHETTLIENFFEYIEIENYPVETITKIKDFASKRNLANLFSFCEYLLVASELLRSSLSLKSGTIEIVLNEELLSGNIVDITSLLTFRATFPPIKVMLTITSLPKDLGVLPTILTRETNLTGLNLSWNCIGRTNVNFVVTALANLPNLECLNLSGNSFGDDEMTLLAPAIQNLSELTYLSLSKNHIRDNGIEALGQALQSLLQLKRLDLSGNWFSDSGIAALVKDFPEDFGLTHLNISNNQITRGGSDSVAKMIQKLFHLKTFKVATNGINNEGAKKIAEVISSHLHLSKVNLEMNDFDSFGKLVLKEITAKFSYMRIIT